MRLASGTSGYSYKEWKGIFYPEDLPAAQMLHYYGERFGAVEINNTFYRMPNKQTLEKWAADVPEGFTFVLKASQRITHMKRLKDASGDVSYLLETAAVLGPKLGPILFQLPPNAKKNLERLEAFLANLPKDRKFAFEFRHPSWFDDEVYAALRKQGAALCLSDMAEEDGEEAPVEKPAPSIVSTADWGYLRLRRCDYNEADLRAWSARIQAEAWNEAFVFFKHEDEGTGPTLALRFTELFREGG